MVRTLQGNDLLNAVSAAEASARNIVSRSFMSASVTGDSGLLSPRILALIGQDLIRSGESVMFLTDGRLNPTSSWEIQKDSRYELTYTPYRMPAGSARTVRVPRTRIFHAVSGLVSLASLAADTTFLRRIEKSFSQEASALVGHIIPSPLTAEKMLKARGQLSALKGKTTFLGINGADHKSYRGK